MALWAIKIDVLYSAILATEYLKGNSIFPRITTITFSCVLMVKQGITLFISITNQTSHVHTRPSTYTIKFQLYGIYPESIYSTILT